MMQSETEFSELFGETEYESDTSESSEAFPFMSGRRPVRVARGSTAYSPRPQGNYVTQQQLQTALQKVAGDIATNSRAIKAVESRVSTVTAEQSRQSAALKKEITTRKTESEAIKKDLRSTREMAAIMPLLTTPQHITLQSQVDSLPQGTQVLVGSNNMFQMLLPLLLLTGTGSGSGSSLFGGDGGSDSTMMLLVLAMAMGGGLGGGSAR